MFHLTKVLRSTCLDLFMYLQVSYYSVITAEVTWEALSPVGNPSETILISGVLPIRLWASSNDCV